MKMFGVSHHIGMSKMAKYTILTKFLTKSAFSDKRKNDIFCRQNFLEPKYN